MSVNKKVLDLLHDQIHNNPDTEALILEFMFIKDLLPFMELLSQFPNLRSLSLHGNSIKELPVDMSMLENLQELDLSNNLLKDVDMLVVSLASLPKLRALHYPIKKEKEDILVKRLKNLQFLNNMEVKEGKKKEERKKLKYMNEESIKSLKKDFNKYQTKILQFQKTYIDEKSRYDDISLQDQVDQIIQSAYEKLSHKQTSFSDSYELAIYNITRHQILNLIQTKIINICTDVYGQLGSFFKHISQQQEIVWKSMATETLELASTITTITESKNQTNKIEETVKKNQLERQIKRLKKSKQEMIGELNSLENQNGRFLEVLVKFSKGDKKILNNFNSNFQIPIAKPVSSPNISRTEKNKSSGKDNLHLNYISNGRNLTLKQLKDTIEDIYQQKMKFDQKNYDGKLPRQTMHQYLFTHLNQKYGLKNLTIEAASSIVAGIQAYSSEDNDVTVFGKILRNQIDEQFRNVQTELKSTINNLLKMHIKNQYPYKNTSEIDHIFKERINGEIGSQEVEDIVKYLYNKEDSNRILTKIEILYKFNKPKEETTHRRLHKEETHEKEKKKIKFTTFVQSVLDFQLRNHQRLLRPLVKVFRHRDSDCDGIVNEEEFILVIEELCEEASEIIPDLLIIVDPYETKSITFTQIVRLVANYPENNPILSRFIEHDEELEQERTL